MKRIHQPTNVKLNTSVKAGWASPPPPSRPRA